MVDNIRLLPSYVPDLLTTWGAHPSAKMKQASELLDCSQSVAPVTKSSTQWTPADGCFVYEENVRINVQPQAM